MSLVIAPCSHKAARYAVENWHYSRQFPVGKAFKVGIWEDEQFIGAIVFTWGANHNLSKAYGLKMTECVELVRVACREHKGFVSQYVSAALRLLKSSNPGIRLVISFADPYQNHEGGIYKAGNWIYLGQTSSKYDFVMPDGKVLNRRGSTGRTFYGARRELPKGAEKKWMPPKHRYGFPLDKAMRRKLVKLEVKFPYAVEGLEESRGDSVSEVLVQSQPTARKSK
jgi:hypothetical protein